MSIAAELREEFGRSERAETATFRVLPYAGLAVCAVVTLIQPLWQEPVHLGWVLGLSALTGLWMLWFRTLHPGRPLLYYAGLMAMTAALVAIAPWYALFAFAGYPEAYRLLSGRWRYAGAAVTATIAGAGFLGGVAGMTNNGLWGVWPGIAVVSTVLAWMMFYFGEMSDRRMAKQRQALDELEAALAENAGLHAQLMVQAREAGVMDERQRMAREIHDTLAQSLAGILTQLQAAERTLDDRPAVSRHLRHAMDMARESLIEARRSVHAVQPAALAEARLPDAIRDVAAKWSEINRVDAALTTTGDARPMHPEVEVTLLRAAQEALANVAKHADAGRVGLTLSYMEDVVTLDVRDDGTGFDPEAGRGDGFGLSGMRRRVQRLAGRLEIESEPGGGTAISVSVPAIPPGGGE